MADGAKTQVAPGKVNVFWNQLLTQRVHPKKTWCLVPIAMAHLEYLLRDRSHFMLKK